MKPEYDLNKTLEYERFFSAEHSESFVLLPGAGSVMLSAPHSVTQTRLGKIKIAEKMTGVLALLVRDATGCPVIFKTKNAGDDAGFDRDSDYKRAAEKYVEENGVRLYDVLDRVSCWCCKNKNRKELKAIYQYLPNYWSRLKELQAQIPMPMKPYSRMGVPYGNVFDLEKVFEKEIREESSVPPSKRKRRRHESTR